MRRRGPPPPPSPDAAPRDFGDYDARASGGGDPEYQRSRAHVPAKQYGKRKVPLSSVNRFGLPSPSEAKYPQAYAPVDQQFWEGLTAEQRYELDRLQAVAQEKVGFERHTPKFFIRDFDPDDPQQAVAMPNERPSIYDPVSGGAITTNRAPRRSAIIRVEPFLADIIVRLPLGGMLIGAGLLAFIFGAAHLVRPEIETAALVLGAATLLAGIGLLWARAG